MPTPLETAAASAQRLFEVMRTRQDELAAENRALRAALEAAGAPTAPGPDVEPYDSVINDLIERADRLSDENQKLVHLAETSAADRAALAELTNHAADAEARANAAEEESKTLQQRTLRAEQAVVAAEAAVAAAVGERDAALTHAEADAAAARDLAARRVESAELAAAAATARADSALADFTVIHGALSQLAGALGIAPPPARPDLAWTAEALGAAGRAATAHESVAVARNRASEAEAETALAQTRLRDAETAAAATAAAARRDAAEAAAVRGRLEAAVTAAEGRADAAERVTALARSEAAEAAERLAQSRRQHVAASAVTSANNAFVSSFSPSSAQFAPSERDDEEPTQLKLPESPTETRIRLLRDEIAAALAS